jgi:ABC-type uncharacterized transport system ATPase subunit
LVINDNLRSIVRISTKRPGSWIINIEISFIIGSKIIIISMDVFILVNGRDDTFSVPTLILCRQAVYAIYYFPVASGDPEIIFLDEPTSGVSPAVRTRFWELISRLAQEGKTIIVTTHHMDEAEQCDRIALMRAGKIIAIGSPGYLEKTAYPEPLIEIRLDDTSYTDTLKTIKDDPDVIAMWPYGLKYHVTVKSKTGIERLLAHLPKGLHGKLIQPSLEDVFIRLIEGVER